MSKIIPRIDYKILNAKQQENYNFYRISAILAEYGFVSFRLTNDWLGADFIAHHNDGETFIKVQLKGRFSLGQKYIGKDVFIAFSEKGEWYLYPHDKILAEFSEIANFKNTRAWTEQNKAHSRGKLSRALKLLLEQYRIYPVKDAIIL